MRVDSRELMDVICQRHLMVRRVDHLLAGPVAQWQGRILFGCKGWSPRNFDGKVGDEG